MLYGAMNFPVRPILEQVKAVAAGGFDYLELAMDPPRAHHKLIREQKRDLLEALDKAGMALVCHLPTFLSTADLTDSLRKASIKEMLESLDVAAELRPLKVVLHPSYVTGLGVFVMEQSRQYALESLEAVVEKADSLGLVLGLENMFPRTRYMTDPAEFAEVFERFPTLKMTLDTGHANIGGRGDKKAIDFIQQFSDRIVHIHANDNFGKEDNHLPVGAGTVDFQKIVKALKNIGYNQTVTLEVFSQDREYLSISREKFAAMIEGL